MRLVGLLAVSVILSSAAVADDWRQFRGNSAGRIDKVTHPLQWSKQENMAWKVPMKGTGWASPIVVGDRIFITSAESDSASRPKGMAGGVASMRSFRSAKPVVHRYVVSCLNLKDGSEIWSKTVGESTPPVVHPSNTYATESPASNGEQLFTFFATTGSLVAWDLDGAELWRRELGSYKSGNGFGTGSSLAIDDVRVFVQFDNDEQSFVVAFEASTGNQLWRDDRPTKTSWSTPLLWQADGQTELVTCGSGVVTSYDPASGNVLWKLSGIDSSFSASPSIADGHIYFGNSGPMSAGPLVAVKAGTRGTIELDGNFESNDVAWSRTNSGPGMASPVVANGCLYIPGRGGVLNCYDAKTGERIYKKRVPSMGTVAASLWADEERVFILDENGSTTVIQAGPEFKLLATNSIDDLFWSTPAIVGDTLLLRGVENLYCIRKP